MQFKPAPAARQTRLSPLVNSATTIRLGYWRWATQESQSMMDTTACWLPIFANHTMTTTVRLDGNGAAYKLEDLGDLVRAAGASRPGDSKTEETLALERRSVAKDEPGLIQGPCGC